MDDRNPAPTNAATSNVMKANKGSGTQPELLLRKALREAGFPGYRKNYRKVPGHPDIAYPGRKVAIFVNGCFWHHCPRCNLPLPKSHSKFWEAKFERNEKRDEIKTAALQAMGWKVITVWECEIRDDLPGVITSLVALLSSDRA